VNKTGSITGAKYIEFACWMNIFIPFAVFSILLFALVIMKRTFIAQLLSPGLHAPLGISEPLTELMGINVEKFEDMRTWMAPY
jgi:hypothetical protein